MYSYLWDTTLVPLHDLFLQAFMDEYTDYQSLEELFEASGFDLAP